MQEVEDFLAYLTGDRGYSMRTIVTYRGALEDFENFFRSLDSGLDWNTLDADVIRRWLALQMDAGCTGRTMAKKLSALRSFFRYRLRMGLMEVNPVSLVKNPKAVHKLPAFIREGEMDRLFDEVQFPDDYIGQRDYCILLTFYNTGIRVSELIGLDMHDVDLSKGELKVTGKRNKQRIVPFGKELTDVLSFYMEARSALQPSTPALFLNSHKVRISYMAVRKVVESYLSLVTTQKKKSPHVLRHTFATMMLNHGADLEAIKELLGHESIATTEVYTHTTFAELKKEYEQAHPRA